VHKVCTVKRKNFITIYFSVLLFIKYIFFFKTIDAMIFKF